MDETLQGDWRLLPAGYAHAPAPLVQELPRGALSGPTAHLAQPMSFFTWAAGVTLALQALVGLASAGVAGWMVLTFAATSSNDVDALAAAPSVQTYLVLTYSSVPLTLATGLFFVLWLYRATRNVELFGVRPRRAAGWAIGAWLVPVVSLWWPKQVVDDVVRGSRPDVPAGCDVRALPRSGWVTAWWSMWLLKTALSQAPLFVVIASLVKAVQANPTSDSVALLSAIEFARLAERVSLWLLGSAVASCLAAAVAVVVVVDIHRSQRQRRQDLELLVGR